LAEKRRFLTANIANCMNRIGKKKGRGLTHSAGAWPFMDRKLGVLGVIGERWFFL